MKIREGETASAIGENPISVADAERREGILAEAREILARQPSAAEIEEDEARRQRNRIDKIMAPRKEPVVYKVNENALIPVRNVRPVNIITKADRARKAALEAKSVRGDRWTHDERVEFWTIHGGEIYAKVYDLVRAKKVSSAIALIIKEIALVSISQTRNREKLEDRIAALEGLGTKGERTVVTQHDAKGRILETIKFPVLLTVTKSGEPMERPRVRVKAIQEIIA